MFLSILLPTIGRKKVKNAIEHFIKSIEHSQINHSQIELIIGDNMSPNSICKYLELMAQKYSFIKHIRYKTFEPTAEDSLIKIMQLAKGEYILTAGDDDLILQNGISKIIHTLKEHNPQFLLLNSVLSNEDFIKPYINILNELVDVITWNTTKEMFYDLGFWGMTTAFSLTCYKRKAFDIKVWEDLMKVARIFSYSFALFINLKDGKAILIKNPIILAGHNNPKKEVKRIGNYTIKYENGLKFSAWTDGTLKLINATAQKCSIDINILFDCENLTINRYGTYFHSQVLHTTLKTICVQLKVYKNNIFLQLRDKEKLIQYLDNIINLLPYDNIQIVYIINRLLQLKYNLINNKFRETKNSIKLAENGILTYKVNEKITKSNTILIEAEQGTSSLNNTNFKSEFLNKPELNTLTILIPTIGRIKDLQKSINIFIQSIIKNNLQNYVEILVVDNQSQDKTQNYIKALELEHSFISYFRHPEFRQTAEESIFYGTETAKGKYIWTFGDDDVPTSNSICNILESIITQEPELILLNQYFSGSRMAKKLLNITQDIIFDRGIDCFKTQGFTSGLIAFISSIVLKKELFKIDLFTEISKISPIYSYPFLMFIQVLYSKVVILAEPSFIYKSNSTEAELKNIGGLADLRFFSWHLGLIRLLEYASTQLSIDIKEMIYYKEYQHSKADGSYNKIYLIHFILYFVKIELKESNNKKHYKKYKAQYSNFALEIMEFLDKVEYKNDKIKNNLQKLIS